ncbi:hypothetical protein AHAS_Ahas16G0283000 [Arachis hypogaea]
MSRMKFVPSNFPLNLSNLKQCGKDPKYYMLKEDVSPCIFGPVEKQRWSYACAKQMTDRLIYGKESTFSLFNGPSNWEESLLCPISSEI